MLNRLWYNLLKLMLQLGGVTIYGVRHWGRENIPKSGGVLVVSNHQSHLDPPLVGIGCPRHMNYLARDTLFRFAPFGWLLQSVGAIKIDREGIGLGGIKESLRRLKRGEMVLIFPEGTRTRDGEVGRFRPGFTVLAARSGASILPVAVDGAYAVWPRKQRFPGLGRMNVRYGRVIPPEEVQGRDEQELLEEIERRVRQCQAELREGGRGRGEGGGMKDEG